MSETTFNLGRWVDRLGWKRPSEPELLYSVQPVQVVSDVQRLTPEIRGPSGLYGGQAVGSVTTYPIYEFICRAEGGALIGSFALSTSIASSVSLAIDQGGVAGFILDVPVVPVVMTPTLQSTGNVGNSVVNIASNSRPLLPGGATNIPAYWPADQMFIRNGFRFILQGGSLNSALRVTHTVQELPAIRGD